MARFSQHMTTEETRFEQELELFRQECESAAQFFFGYLAIHEVAKRRAAVFQLLNRNAMFWKTTTGAMQTAAIVAVGRVFDQGSPHNIDSVLRLAQDSPSIFSRASLGRRKQGGAGEEPSWLTDYLNSAYVPWQLIFDGSGLMSRSAVRSTRPRSSPARHTRISLRRRLLRE